MSLNKFCSLAVRKEWMEINCASVDCSDLLCESINGKPVVGAVYAQVAPKTVFNTIVETTLNTSGFGSFAVPANYFTVGSSFKVRASGTLNNLVGVGITFRFYLGLNGTANIFSFPITAIPVATAGKAFKLEFSFTVVDDGVVGSSGLFGVADFTSQGDATFTQRLISFSSVNFDTTAVNQFFVSAEFGSASASNSLLVSALTILKEA